MLCAVFLAITQVVLTPSATQADVVTTFTFADVPDTQREVHRDDNPLLPDRYQWLSDNKESLNLKFITHTGDLTDWGHVDPAQFTRASSATNILDNSGVPYSYAIGNHDSAAVKEGGSAASPGNTRTLMRETSAFNTWFPLSRFKNVGGTFEPNKVDNMYQTFSAGGLDWLVVTLEMWPRVAVVDWAKEVVESHPHHNVVITTHAFTDNVGAYPTAGNYGDTNAQVMWDRLVSQYTNIKFVVSGHYGPNTTLGYGGYNYSEATGVNGNKVAQIMTAYHSNWQNHVRLLKVDTANGSITSQVYVPTSIHSAYPSGYIHDAASDFVTSGMVWIQPETQTPPPAPTAPSAPVLVTASAGDASAQVSFVPASNGGASVTSYTVTSLPGDVTVTGTTSPITVSGLTNGVTYTFTVTATNSVGTSSVSSPSNAVTPAATPVVTELLSDPGFETGVGGWKPFSVGNFSRISNPVQSGSYALNIGATSSTLKLVGMTHNSVVTNSVAGKSYTAQCYVQPTGTGLNVKIRFMEYTQTWSSYIDMGSTVISNLPANTWTLAKVTGTATASGKRIVPQIYATNQTTSTGSLIYDNCSVTAN
jgi:hypothetical protein